MGIFESYARGTRYTQPLSDGITFVLLDGDITLLRNNHRYRYEVPPELPTITERPFVKWQRGFIMLEGVVHEIKSNKESHFYYDSYWREIIHHKPVQLPDWKPPERKALQEAIYNSEFNKGLRILGVPIVHHAPDSELAQLSQSIHCF
jgi:hypothetical protein